MKQGVLSMRSALLLSIFSACAVLRTASAGGDGRAEVLARRLVSESGLKGGFISHVGLRNPELTAALRLNSRFTVHGLSRERSLVLKARGILLERGLLGPVQVCFWSGGVLPYPSNFVNLLVVEENAAVGKQEILRVLAPGGVALKFNGSAVEKISKPYPAGMDSWSHWLHGPDGNPVARDLLVGPPAHLQWICSPKWARHHDTVPTTTAFVSDGGRVFYISDEAPAGLPGTFPDRWFLVARDAFNGVELWRKPIRAWGWRQWSAQWKGRFNIPPELPKRLVCTGDRLYATLGFWEPVSELDASTGEVLRVFDETHGTDEILHRAGLLVLAVNEEKRRPSREDRRPVRKSLCVLDLASGRLLWRYDGLVGLHAKYNSAEPFGRLELTVGDDCVFAVNQKEIFCFDLRSGKIRWRIARPPFREHLVMYGIRMSDQCVALYSGGVLLFAQPEMKRRRSWHTLPGTLYAFRASDGTELWSHRYGGWPHNWQPDIFVIDGTVWFHEHIDVPFKGHDIKDKSKVRYSLLGLDLRTGKLKRRISTEKIFNVGHHHRCYREKATVRYVLSSRRGVEFIDLETGTIRLNHWVRGGCLHGFVPCNGFLYATPHPCECFIETSIKGYAALAPERNESAFSYNTVLERGPGYGSFEKKESDPGDWPTFRHDNLRSGVTDVEIGRNLHHLWRSVIGGRITPPTVAEGCVFAARLDSGVLVALDAASGRKRWSYAAGARITTPPTVSGGCVFFGSNDGWVYCLRVRDGRLVWRFRAAPSERYILVDNLPESAWPVHGSLLLQEGKLYAVAGRSTYLDHGLFAYELEPATGEVTKRRVLFSPDPRTGEMPAGDAFRIPGTLNDVPVGDGKAVFVRKQLVFGTPRRGTPHLAATGGLRDDSWFNRIRWIIGRVNDASQLVFSRGTAWGIIAYPPRSRRSSYQPVEKGYLLFAKRYVPEKGVKKSSAGYLWRRRVPIRFEAFALAGRILVAAGVEVPGRGPDPLAPFEGRGPGVLCLFSADKGGEIRRFALRRAPVFDGLAVARGRVYVSLRDGSVVCFGERREESK